MAELISRSITAKINFGLENYTAGGDGVTIIADEVISHKLQVRLHAVWGYPVLSSGGLIGPPVWSGLWCTTRVRGLRARGPT